MICRKLSTGSKLTLYPGGRRKGVWHVCLFTCQRVCNMTKGQGSDASTSKLNNVNTPTVFPRILNSWNFLATTCTPRLMILTTYSCVAGFTTTTMKVNSILFSNTLCMDLYEKKQSKSSTKPKKKRSRKSGKKTTTNVRVKEVSGSHLDM